MPGSSLEIKETLIKFAPPTSMNVVVSAGANHVKGSWTVVSSGLPCAISGVRCFYTTDAGSIRYLMDIGVRLDTGSFEPVISDILINAGGSMNGHSHNFLLPISFQQSACIAVRGQNSSAANANITLHLHGVKNDGQLANPGYSIARVYGTNPATTIGTVVDPGGVANTYGAWTTVATQTQESIREFLLLFGNRGQTVIGGFVSRVYDIGIGDAGAEVVLVEKIGTQTHTVDDTLKSVAFGPYPTKIPSGSRIAMRCVSATTDAEDRLAEVCIVGLS